MDMLIPGIDTMTMRRRGSFATVYICLIFLLFSSFLASGALEVYHDYSAFSLRQIDELKRLSVYDLRAQLFETIREGKLKFKDIDQEIEINGIIIYSDKGELLVKGE